MTTHGEAAAAPVDIKLGGETYRMNPLTGRDIAELEHWLQSEAISRVRQSLGNASAAEYERAMQAAIAASSTLSLASSRGASLFSTISGMARMLWQGIHHNHPDIGAEDIETMLFDGETLAEAELALERANHFEAVKKNKPPRDGRKKQRKRERQARKRGRQ